MFFRRDDTCTFTGIKKSFLRVKLISFCAFFSDNRVVTLSDLSGNQTYYWVDKLEENVTYTFTVVAKTIVGPGPERENSIKTGPQTGNNIDRNYLKV